MSAHNQLDANSYLATFAPEYHTSNRAGTVENFEQIRKRVVRLYSGKRTYNYQFQASVQGVKLTGDQALAVVKEHSDTSRRYPKTGASYKTTLDEVAETLWKKQSNGWVETNYKVLSFRNVLEE